MIIITSYHNRQTNTHDKFRTWYTRFNNPIVIIYYSKRDTSLFLVKQFLYHVILWYDENICMAWYTIFRLINKYGSESRTVDLFSKWKPRFYESFFEKCNIYKTTLDVLSVNKKKMPGRDRYYIVDNIGVYCIYIVLHIRYIRYWFIYGISMF